jgi:hypothetical protein
VVVVVTERMVMCLEFAYVSADAGCVEGVEGVGDGFGCVAVVGGYGVGKEWDSACILG